MILKLKPACKNYLWGGHRLVEEYGVEYDGEILAEAWELSAHPDGASIITNGEFAGKTLREFLDAEGLEVLGTHCRRFREFPILTKFIDAKDNLSIQVHPDDSYALKNENQFGKDEFWYIIDAAPNAFIYYGFKQKISREEFKRRIEENNLLEVLNKVEVKKGDSFFIPAGTLHSVGAGVLLAEIQRSSNVTYRIYDYGRGRPLHIEKALDVTNLSPPVHDVKNFPRLAACKYFIVDKINLDGKIISEVGGSVDEKTFLNVLILDGAGKIFACNEELNFQKGDSIFISANSGKWKICGSCDALLTTI